MANEVTLNCMLNTAVVPAAAEPRLVYLLVDIKPGSEAAPLQAPVNIAVILDVSESMRLPVLSQEQFQELSRLGEVNQTTSDGVPVWTFRSIPEHIRKQAPSNVEAVQASIAQAARHFEAHDRVSLVAFADRADVLLRGVSGSDSKQVLEAIAALGSAQLGDNTEISAGLEAGLTEIYRGQTAGMVNRALILTDGFTRDPKKVLSLAKGARNVGIAVSTLGIGSEFNEKLLVEVADASLGNAYFARTPQDIPPAFGQELAAVQAVTLRDVQVDLKLSAGVELRRAYRVRPAISVANDARKGGRDKSIPLGDLDPANPPALLAELLVPTQQGGTFRVAQVSTTHAGASGERVAGAITDVVLKYSMSKAREEQNPVVMNTVERVMAYVLQTRALDDMELGNTAAATQKLRAAATRLLSVGEANLAEAVEAEAARVEQSGQVSPENAKELRYATRKLTQRLEA
ncbi:MAG TPA: VWA domain-containing protein [Chloroflexia bacterium]|nr:VWA domain-containing protein [Chloroflexia bacterium]